MKATTEQEKGYSHVLKYTGIFGGVQGLNLLIGLVRNKIISQLLGPAGMGLASLFNTAINFVSQATNLGISFSAVRHISELFDSGDEARIAHYIRVVRAWSLLTALAGVLVCMLAGPLLSAYTFSGGNHTLQFLLLSPAVGFLAISGGETAILKGARRLKALALVQMFGVLMSVFISVPIYYFYGQAGIVPVIVLMAFVTMVLTQHYSYHFYPLQWRGSRGILGEGMEMVRLGVAFVLAGIIGSGAEMLIRSYLNVQGSLDVVGLYNAGFMITVTCATTVFSAMEADFFPRLSSVNRDVPLANSTINRQIEVSILIISPLLAVLIVAMPIVIPLLYTQAFFSVVGMARVAVFSMYIKAISLPISYLTLARGDSLAYLLLESVYDVVLVMLMVIGFRHWGLMGTGVALSLSYLLDIAIVYSYTHVRYGYRVTPSVLRYSAIQLLLGVAVFMAVQSHRVLVCWVLAPLLCIVSLVVSLYILHQKTSLWAALRSKFLSKMGHHES